MYGVERSKGIKISIDYTGDKETRQGFFFKIIKCAIEHCHPKKAVEEGLKKYYSLHVVMHGSGVIEKNGKSFTLRRGDCFALFAGEECKYYPSRTDPWSYAYADFYLENGEQVLADCGFTKDNFIVNYKDEEIFENMQQLVSAFNYKDMMPLGMEGQFLTILAKFIKLNNTRRTDIDNSITSEKRKVSNEIVIFINNNFRMQICMEDIAKALGYSVGYLITVLTRTIGWSPIRYLNEYRIAYACEMLLETNKSIKEIAYDVGYTDPLYFSRIFNKIKGCSPKEYRENSVEDNPFEFLIEKDIDFR